ncbi:hypothetical protein CFC21_051197 [Triticum aestivum]|uniref:Amine oxidase domain-containing protein n=2 Tax=Triticum aestivum TaxID=4565 RepID=A0A9R1K589_WHEAT|nr:hypothetical protein CFC21_051194 [Triticum aestivum]KAF7041396.1 hypothetical protein CFC21_051197 [Triticum aestivum]
MTPTIATALVLALTLAHHASLASAAGHRVIIVGAGMSGISAGKRLSEAGITDLLILEATDHVGGRMRKRNFGGVNVEMGANWVEGVNGGKMNPIWPLVNSTLKLRNFRSDFDGLAENVYKERGGVYDRAYVQKRLHRSNEVEEGGAKLSAKLRPSGQDDMSILTMQRLNNHLPNGPASPVDMILDYFKHDYEFAEPPRVTSLQNVVPLATFRDYVYFVADRRGYEAIVHHLAGQYLEADKSGNIVVREISHSGSGVAVKTEDDKVYKADYVMVSTSVGVLQSDLIQFKPRLPAWKILSIYQFDMAVYTKIFVKFPRKFWPEGKGREFFLYASSRRGYYGVWRRQRSPGDRHRRGVEADRAAARQPDQGGDRGVLGEDVPDATDILVPRWWSDRFYRGTFSNWPIGVNRYEYDQLRAPVGRVYFSGEHTSEHYNGYVHGAYLSGIDSADILIKCAHKRMCKHHIPGKFE